MTDQELQRGHDLHEAKKTAQETMDKIVALKDRYNEDTDSLSFGSSARGWAQIHLPDEVRGRIFSIIIAEASMQLSLAEADFKNFKTSDDGKLS